MKTCTKCNTAKPLEQFRKDPRCAGGHKCLCNDCKREYNRLRYQRVPKVREQQRVYRRSEHGRHLYRAAVQRRENLLTFAEKRDLGRVKKERAKLNPDYWNRRHVSNAVFRAVKRGDLPPVVSLECQSCGKPAQHYHHHNGYDQEHRLDVVPLCSLCHGHSHRAPLSVGTIHNAQTAPPCSHTPVAAT